MPRVNMASMPADTANQILRNVENLGAAPQGSEEDLAVQRPPALTFQLGGWYTQSDGALVKEFEVRELTGRDEEAMARITDAGDVFPLIMERGLVRLGQDKPDKDLVDTLLAGDWSTILLAIRRVTFGDSYDLPVRCSSCSHEYTHEIDLSGIPVVQVAQDDMAFEWEGRHGTKYEATMLFGAGQRKILTGKKTGAQMATQVLRECVQSMNGMPVVTDAQILDMPLTDRRSLMRQIMDRKAGPQLEEVETTCPACGAEQRSTLGIADMFR